MKMNGGLRTLCNLAVCLALVLNSQVQAQDANNNDFHCPTTNASRCRCDNPGTPENGCSRAVDSCRIEFWCSPGYRLEGKASTRCRWNVWAVGYRWNNARPYCIEITCPERRDPRNGRVFGAEAPFRNGAELTYECNRGYYIHGSETSRCQNGQWSTSPPACQPVSCGDPGTPLNGRRTGGIIFGSQLIFTCATGYTLAGSYTMECQADGTWFGQRPTCEKIVCGDPGAPLNGEILAFRGEVTYDYGSNLEFRCNRGFRLIGSSLATCTAEGTWSPSIPTCQVVTCPLQSVEDHVRFEPNTGSVFLVGAQLDFSCDVGYRLLGQRSVECTATGDWTYRFPTCQLVTCSRPRVPTHGERIGDTFSFGSVVSFSCEEGHTLRGPSHLLCEERGRWNGTVPWCQDDGCGVPEAPEHGSVQNHGVSVGSVSTFQCDEEYRLHGKATITCAVEGWDGPIPECREIHCPTIRRIANGWHEGNNTKVGSEVLFYCDEHHTLEGTGNVVCQTDGKWSHPLPTCEGNQCSRLRHPEHGTLTATTFTFGAIAEFSCFRGHRLSGSSRTQCQGDGTWSSPAPICLPCDVGFYKENVNEAECTRCPELSSTSSVGSTSRLQCVCQGDTTGLPGGPCVTVQCPVLDPPENGQVTQCERGLNGRCYVECDPGYVVRGNRVRTCFKDGWFQGNNPPTCRACPEDTFSVGGSGTSCRLCPAHSSTLGQTAVSSLDRCVCDEGYERNSPDGPCEDANECSSDEGRCTGLGARCHNLDGSFVCACSIPGYSLDASGTNCVVNITCEDLTTNPENGRVQCFDILETNSKRCHIICNPGFSFVSGVNNYLTCGSSTHWRYSHQLRNVTASVPGCMPEFLVDTAFNVTTTLDVPRECETYENNLETPNYIENVLQTEGDCSLYQCSINRQDIYQSCTNTDSTASELVFNFTIYLENPETLAPDCTRYCQQAKLREMLAGTLEVWQNVQVIFAGDLGQVRTEIGALITLTGAKVVTHIPQVLCHEEGRVFTNERLCVPCPAGYYVPNGRQRRSTCLPCPEGEYQDQAGQTSCISCPGQLTTLDEGSVSLDQCISGERVDIYLAGLGPESNVVIEQ